MQFLLYLRSLLLLDVTGCICWSLQSLFTSSYALAMIMHMGQRASSFICMCSRQPSSSWDLAMLAPSFPVKWEGVASEAIS